MSLPEDRVMIDGNEELLIPAGVPECLVDERKRMRRLGQGSVDSDDISRKLAMEIRNKTMPLNIFFQRPDVRYYDIPGFGHGGLIRKEPLSHSPGDSVTRFSVIPVTAKHNLRKIDFGGHEFVPAEAKLNAVSACHSLVHFVSADMGWTPTADDAFMLRPELDPTNTNVTRTVDPKCKFGFNISLGREINSTEHPATQPFCSFSMVRDTFKPKVGQKVAIAVLFSDETKPTEATIAGCAGPVRLQDFPETFTLEEVYGEVGKLNIYTGVIEYVGTHHIEYTINSFTGCSGAIVFLLDLNQPEDSLVQQCDHGCAIAVHSGAHPTIPDRNYGFLLRAHDAFKPPSTETAGTNQP